LHEEGDGPLSSLDKGPNPEWHSSPSTSLSRASIP